MSEQQKVSTPTDLINPQSQGYINGLVSAAVKEAVASVFAGMAPMLQSIALTPEKLREATKPYIDPAAVARETRERQLMREDLAEAERQKEASQRNCSHKDQNLRWSVSAIHNFPDRQVRLICVKCHRLVQPTRWEIGPPDAKNPRGKPALLPADVDYARMLADVSQQAQTV